MENPVQHTDQVVHIRVILGVVMGLSLARLLNGLARFVQHPNKSHIYPVHIGWVLFLFLAVVHFWWFEFGLLRIIHWTFELYIFVILYAALFFFVCALLFPDQMNDYSGYADYFHSRQKWFYGLLAALYATDVMDTLIKGMDHFREMGLEYPIRQTAMIALSLAAMFIKNRRFHLWFVVIALIVQIVWIVQYFQVLS
ncbi:hypothetical protein NA8A_03990 [Nitratireductor indicus C115]|uniref:Transmembrane protein n=1 Tax=Nitratireductor indicus C115 TaxID=1231190 RepID=K2NXF6_9HYPH|nr:hypothetical protein [Nitratireductor indicus]EKF43940.1 hypothetical protein NA8A_03990 [Nitratireductor indicus C115]SFQ13772.1 hypothetical protein SAMN05216176_101518 [Nitratireductor indicus]